MHGVRISATELARTTGDVLSRVCCRGDTFVVERNGDPVARIVPLSAAVGGTFADLVRLWKSHDTDPRFADDLDLVNALDRPPDDAWAS
jgi:antitoxin (DNA-binding transcriptional repressor) of toxin-antitoxin stability system